MSGPMAHSDSLNCDHHSNSLVTTDNEGETFSVQGATLASHVASSSSHDDLCRTVSDTLAAEYSEYVTRIKTTPFGQQWDNQVSPLDEYISDSNYTSKVEFGLKLGYTEEQVQIALVRLGPSAGQNELLAELIKLDGVSNSKSSSLSSYGQQQQHHLSDESSGPFAVMLGDNNCSLRPIVIDGSNVAMSHGKDVFSCKGIKICVDWFKGRGHKEITVFVPMWRKEVSRPDAPIKDRDILLQLELERLLVFTPSRNVGGRRMVCYDDRYILKLALESDGIVVSNDNYRDLVNENPEYKKLVEERLLMYSFVNDRFMPPDDPLGRKGPSLDNFLKKKPSDCQSPPCPYGKKCTYGNKCKYYHPERGNQPQKSVTERLVEHAKIQLQEVKARNCGSKAPRRPGEKSKVTHTYSLPPRLPDESMSRQTKAPLSRTKSVTPGNFGQSLHQQVARFDHGYGGAPPTFQSSSSFALGHQAQRVPLHQHTSQQQHHHQHLLSSNSCADLFTDRLRLNEHLALGQRFSDPGNQAADCLPSGSPLSAGPSSWRPYQQSNSIDHLHLQQQRQQDGAANLHRKLKRQLSLNPTYDPRLSQMTATIFESHQQSVQRPHNM
ncbi:putative ribonuclease ZC3H12C [Halotydeus destructor]|nr:putative ribonuclease ZC3H12C [Halotydeus destructor]